MKYVYGLLVPSILSISVFLSSSSSVFGQDRLALTDGIPPPVEEEFAPSPKTLVPMRQRSCGIWARKDPEVNGCVVFSYSEWWSLTDVSLYDVSGRVWRTFTVNNHRDEKYFGRYSKEFLPFATPGAEWEPPTEFILRVSGESKNWYRVVVNEVTGDERYVLKNDPNWWETTYDYWLSALPNLKPLKGKPLGPLYARPGGDIITDTEQMAFSSIIFRKLDKPAGEWILLDARGNDGKNHSGWLRWRNGREFLIWTHYSKYPCPDKHRCNQ